MYGRASIGMGLLHPAHLRFGGQNRFRKQFLCVLFNGNFGKEALWVGSFPVIYSKYYQTISLDNSQVTILTKS